MTGLRILCALAIVLSACSTASGSPTPSIATSTTVPTTTRAAVTSTTAAPEVANPPPPADEDLGEFPSEWVSLDVDGVIRRYLLTIPDTAAVPAPLVLDLHGLTSNPVEQDALSGMRAKGTEVGFVVAQPLGRGGRPFWETTPSTQNRVNPDVAFLRAVVADVRATVSIDPDRIYVTGMSNGGGMANRFACEAAEQVAAIGVVSAALTFSTPCESAAPVAVIAFHGTADRVVPYEGAGRLLPPVRDWAAEWAERNGCDRGPEREDIVPGVTREQFTGCEAGADVELYTIEGGGHGWPGTALERKVPDSTQAISATDLIWDFFTRHHR